MFYVISVFGVASVVIYYFVTRKRNYGLWPSELLTYTQEEEDAVYPQETKEEDALHVDNDITSTEPSDVVYPVSEEENIWDSIQEGETVSDTIPVNAPTVEEARPNIGLDAVQQLALEEWKKEREIQTKQPEEIKFDIDELPKSQTEDFKADPKPTYTSNEAPEVKEVKKSKPKKKRVRRYRTCANCANWKPIEPVEPKK